MRLKKTCQVFLVLNLMLCLTFAAALLVLQWRAGSVGFGGASVLCLGCLFCWGGAAAGSLWGLRRGFHLTVARLWLVLTGFLLPYLAAEAILVAVRHGKLSAAVIPDRTLHHTLQPGVLSEVYTAEFQYLQQVNSLGMRGADIAIDRTAGACRVLMLGDSFTMGTGVADDETFSVLLQNSWNERAAARGVRQIAVFNGGVESYAPILCYLRLKQLQPLLQPEIVILNFDVSDLLQEVAYRRLATFFDSGEILGVDGTADADSSPLRSTVQEIRGLINQNLVLTRLLLAWLDRWTEAATEPTVANTVRRPFTNLLRHTLAADNVNRDQEWSAVFDSIERLHRFCDERDIRFVLTQYPWGHQVSDSEWLQGRRGFVPDGEVTSDRSVERLESFARQRGITSLNLYSAFRGAAGNSPLYHCHDMHWTPAGHRVMARGLESFLIEYRGIEMMR